MVYSTFVLQKTYKSSWEAQRDKGFELRMDALSIFTAKANRDLASDVSDHSTINVKTIPAVWNYSIQSGVLLKHSTALNFSTFCSDLLHSGVNSYATQCNKKCIGKWLFH